MSPGAVSLPHSANAAMTCAMLTKNVRRKQDALDGVGGLSTLTGFAGDACSRCTGPSAISLPSSPPKLHPTFTLPARIIHEGSFLLGSPGRVRRDRRRPSKDNESGREE